MTQHGLVPNNVQVLDAGDWADAVTSALMCLGVPIFDRHAIIVGKVPAIRAVTHPPVLTGILSAISLALLVSPHNPVLPGVPAAAAPQLSANNVITAAARLSSDERRLLRAQFLQDKWFATGGKAICFAMLTRLKILP